jgi:hypothetical protein
MISYLGQPMCRAGACLGSSICRFSCRYTELACTTSAQETTAEYHPSPMIKQGNRHSVEGKRKYSVESSNSNARSGTSSEPLTSELSGMSSRCRDYVTGIRWSGLRTSPFDEFVLDARLESRGIQRDKKRRANRRPPTLLAPLLPSSSTPGSQ